MPQIRRRYYIWLLKAYFKKWKKTILLSTVIGVVLFFALIMALNFFIGPHLHKKTQTIGYWGSFSGSNLPDPVLSSISYGLTSVDSKGAIHPAAASSWEITNNGKTYTFHLKDGLKFHDGEKLNADTLDLHFKDVKFQKVNANTVKYTLQNPYAPFLSAVSKPIFVKNSNGLGDFKVTNIDVNGGFVKSINVTDTKNSQIRKHIYFYPTQDALKLAFIMGEVDEIDGIDNANFLKTNFKDWPNAAVSKQVDTQNMVTLFYNTQDSILSDKKIRQALNYALPQKFSEGKKSYSPIIPTSEYYYTASESQPVGADLAKTVLQTPGVTIDQDIIISTTPEYEQTALEIQDAWKKVGVKSKIKVVNSIPSDFQVLLYKFKVPVDPDQYTLWHSKGMANITKYKNLRIDKLLEDGRSTSDHDKRLTAYSDFQKYLLDDAPASFLYFPYTYTVKRK